MSWRRRRQPSALQLRRGRGGGRGLAHLRGGPDGEVIAHECFARGGRGVLVERAHVLAEELRELLRRERHRQQLRRGRVGLHD